MKTRFLRAVAALTLLLILASNTGALACAACYNPAGSDRMTNAATVGIFAMVVIMFGMLGAVAAFGWRLAYLAKHPLPDYEDLLSPDEDQSNPGLPPKPA
jgi:hypothetical protein